MIIRPQSDQAKQYLVTSNKAKRTSRTLTHIGVYSPPIGAKKWIALAESPKYWIDMHGNKYNKTHGTPAGTDFATSKVLLETIHTPT